MVGDTQFRQFTTKEKALKINSHPSIYGTFAEIGAGQEVASQFFRAGRASGTVAKTISAYDMTFSDAIYGKTNRYVSKERLNDMLEKEYQLLTKRLIHRAKRSTFFVFADTVFTTKASEAEQHYGHGWAGVRFQFHHHATPNDCIIHIVLKDVDIKWQQETLGIVGVNLIYACYFHREPEAFICSLRDNLPRESIEIDMFQLTGPDFSHIDNRLMSLKLVKNGLTNAAMFGPDGKVLQPYEALYQKDVLVLRGRFKPVTLVSVDMMIAAGKQFKKEETIDNKRLITLSELTLNDLTNEGEVDEHDFLDRVDILCSLGQYVLISNYIKYFKLSKYLSNCNSGRKLGIILGYNNLMKIFDESYYKSLAGGLLEAFGQLFSKKVKLYVYPCLNAKGGLCTCKDLDLGTKQELFTYLYKEKRILDIEHVNKKHMHIISDHVLEMLQKNQKGWENYVPHKVSAAIKEKVLFNYPTPITPEED